MTNRPTSEVLNLAADLIEERGWVGTEGKGWGTDGNDPLCIEGAIKAAVGITDQLGIRAVNTCPAGRAVRDYLELGEFDYRTALFMWNDAGKYVDGTLTSIRTATEVVEVLRATALIESARERETAEVSA